MANFKQHKETGAEIGAVAGMLTCINHQFVYPKTYPYYQFNWGQVFVSGIIGYGLGTLGGILPDVFEPATHPHHRKSLHSITAGTTIVMGLKKLNESNISVGEKVFVNSIGASYLSHLLLDSNTAKGLPLI
jgi:hypothetical protein